MVVIVVPQGTETEAFDATPQAVVDALVPPDSVTPEPPLLSAMTHGDD